MSEKSIKFGKLKEMIYGPTTKPPTVVVPKKKTAKKPIKEKQEEKEEERAKTYKDINTVVVTLNGIEYRITSDLCRNMKFMITKTTSRERIRPIAKFFVKIFSAVLKSR